MSAIMEILKEWKEFKRSQDNYSFEERKKIRNEFRKALDNLDNEPLEI